MKVYIIKYALTTGIIEREVVQISSTMVSVKSDRWMASFHKPYWHETREEAVKHAEILKGKKKESLLKQLKKLDKTVF